MGFSRSKGDLATIGESFASALNLGHFNDFIPRHLDWDFHTADFSVPGVVTLEGVHVASGQDVDLRIVIDEISVGSREVVHKA